MIIDDSVIIDAPLARVWAVLCNVPLVAQCIPHATVVEERNARNAIVRIGICIGLVAVTYTAEIALLAADSTAGTATLAVDARDKRGRPAVHAAIEAQLQAEGSATRVALRTHAEIGGLLGGLGERVIAAAATCAAGDFAARVALLAGM